MDCPIHKEVPTDNHHIVPKAYGGEDSPENLTPLCRRCHRELHAADGELHKRGWRGLVDVIGIDNICAYMQGLAKRRVALERERLGDEAYRQRMRELARRRWE